MTEMITITFADASTLDLPVYDKSLVIDYVFDGLEIARQPNKVGITNDPNYNWRKVSCTSYHTAATIVDTIDGKLRPAAVPTYDGTDPKVLVYLSGSKSMSILCAIKKAKVSHRSNDKYDIDWEFHERTL